MREGADLTDPGRISLDLGTIPGFPRETMRATVYSRQLPDDPEVVVGDLGDWTLTL